MAAGQGQLIQLSDYTTIKNKVDAVFGTGSGDSGYGQPSTTIIKSANSTISHTEWVALRNDMTKVRQHQIGGTIGTSTALDGENLVDLSVINPPPILITEDIRNQYDNFSNIITTNRFLIDNNNKSTSSATSATYTNEWNGTLIHTLAMTGVSTGDGSANNIRYFFNSGSVINFSASRTGTGIVLGGANNEKYTAWTTLLGGIGSISFGYTSTTTTGNGTGSSIGWYDLTTSDQMIFQLLGSNITALVGTEYETNAYQIYARRDTDSTTVTFTIKFCDIDVAGTDINVGGTLTSGIVQVHAFGSNVSVSPLIASSTPGNNAFSGGVVVEQVRIVASATTIPSVILVGGGQPNQPESSSVTFTVTTQYLPDSRIYWVNTGTSGAVRFTDNMNSGYVDIVSGSGSIVRSIAADANNYSDQTIKIQLYKDEAHTIIYGTPSPEVIISAKVGISFVNTVALPQVIIIANSSGSDGIYETLSAASNGAINGLNLYEDLVSQGEALDHTKWQNGYGYMGGSYSSLVSTPTAGIITVSPTSSATSVVSGGNGVAVTLTVPNNYILSGIAVDAGTYGNDTRYASNYVASTEAYLLVNPLLDSTGSVLPSNRVVHSDIQTTSISVSWEGNATIPTIPNGYTIRQIALTVTAGVWTLSTTLQITYAKTQII